MLMLEAKRVLPVCVLKNRPCRDREPQFSAAVSCRPAISADNRILETKLRQATVIALPHRAAALPHRQSDFINPLAQWSTRGILIELVLNSDHIGPSGIVGGPGLIQSVRVVVKHECVVAIGRWVDALDVQLDVVPARRPVRARNPIQDPTIALAIPGGPVAVSKVALTADARKN